MKTSFLIIICVKYLLYLLDHIMQQMDIKIPQINAYTSQMFIYALFSSTLLLLSDLLKFLNK